MHDKAMLKKTVLLLSGLMTKTRSLELFLNQIKIINVASPPLYLPGFSHMPLYTI